MLVCAIAFSVAFATILLAHIFERFGYAPCPLCLQERYAFFFGVPATIAARKPVVTRVRRSSMNPRIGSP